MPFETDSHLTTKQAALFLGFAPGTLANWRVLGRGPKFAKGPGKNGFVRYAMSELLAWRDANTRRSTADKRDGAP